MYAYISTFLKTLAYFACKDYPHSSSYFEFSSIISLFSDKTTLQKLQ